MININTLLSVNGNELGFSSPVQVSIKSVYNGHHRFEIIFPIHQTDEIELQDLEAVLGEFIDIQFESEEGNKKGVFHGVIDEIIPVWSSNGGKNIILKGYSPTIFLDTAPKFRCASNQGLESLVNKVLSSYKKYFKKVKVDGNKSEELKCSIQKNETDYSYLLNLADQSEKELYYDGKSLFFSDLTKASNGSIRLVKGEDLLSFQIALNTAPLDFSVSGYDFINGKRQESKADRLFCNNQLLNSAINKSKYPVQKIFLSHAIEGDKFLRRKIRRLASKQAHELLVLRGRSVHPGLKIGCRVRIDQNDNLLSEEVKETQFIVINVTHQIKSGNKYENDFVAVPVDHPYNLRMGLRPLQTCPPMAAIVADVDDPKKLGRVRVQFIQDIDKGLSPWLRVLTPTTANGGFFCVPKRNEQVIVFHEGDIENSAFVLGSFYNKSFPAKKWGNPAKDIGLTTQDAGIYIDGESGTIHFWGKRIEGVAEENWIWEGKGGYMNCNKGKKPKIEKNHEKQSTSNY